MSKEKPPKSPVNLKQYGAGAILVAVISGLSVVLGGPIGGLFSQEKPRENEKKIIKLEAQVKSNTQNFEKMYKRLQSIDNGQKTILMILQQRRHR